MGWLLIMNYFWKQNALHEAPRALTEWLDLAEGPFASHRICCIWSSRCLRAFISSRGLVNTFSDRGKADASWVPDLIGVPATQNSYLICRCSHRSESPTAWPIEPRARVCHRIVSDQLGDTGCWRLAGRERFLVKTVSRETVRHCDGGALHRDPYRAWNLGYLSGRLVDAHSLGLRAAVSLSGNQ
jgi:hypothetical protein